MITIEMNATLFWFIISLLAIIPFLSYQAGQYLTDTDNHTGHASAWAAVVVLALIGVSGAGICLIYGFIKGVS